MPSPAPPDWALIRSRYEETDDPAAEICAAHGVARAELTAAARRGFWRRQKPRPFPPPRTPIGSAASSPADPIRPRPVSPSRAGDAPTLSDVPTSPRAPARPPADRKRLTRKTPVAAPRATTRALITPDSTTPATEPAEAQCEPARSPRAKSRARPAKLSPAARRSLLGRLVAAISLKLEQLERRMANDLATADHHETASATDHERETRAIGALIDNLGKVTEMETGHARTHGKSAASDIAGDADRWRRELAERLAKIVGPAASAA